MANETLAKAKEAKNDEFYTQYYDIEREMEAYLEYDPDVFRGKTVLLPCDDPEWSNFTLYFAQNFESLGLKKLISTSYAPESKKYKYPIQLTLFETGAPQYDAVKAQTNGKIFVLTHDKTGDGHIDHSDLEWDYLEGDGDFRSEEVTKLRDEADIIVTNPPFSLFKEFFAWIMDSDKQFVMIGNKNCVTYKEMFPYIKDNKVWSGRKEWAGGMWFKTMNEDDVDKVINGVNMKNVPSIWITNIDHGRRHEPLQLMTMGDNLKYSRHKEIRGRESYGHYENYDAIEVPYTDAIPSDYEGTMGVPISFLDKYCPEQFEILGMCENEDLYGLKTKVYSTAECKQAYFDKFNKKGTYDLNASGVIIVDNKREKVYQRILIRKKQ
ncbi:MAG: DNA methyltransferase [Prevotella sp.]|nr:DNA methyltransferase [Prevotella sp.]